MLLTKDLRTFRNSLSVLIAFLGLTWFWATMQQHWLKDFIEPGLVVVGSLIGLCQFLMLRWGGEDVDPHPSFNLPDTSQNRTVLQEAKATIQQGKPEQALRLLTQFKISSIEESVTLLSARLAKYQRVNLQGIDSNDDNNRTFNRINADILTLIQALEAEIKKSAALEFTIKELLQKRYDKRLNQKLAGRQPVNLRQLVTSEGTSAETSSGFVVYNTDEIRVHIAEIFKDAYGRLLITGVPGAGKTTLLIQLELSLLASEPDKLPVILNLATWKNEYITLDTWLKEILPTELGVSQKLASDIMAQNELILLFDGFDEIKEKNRETCLEAIGDYGKVASRKFVITSRIEEYKKVAKDAPVYLQIEVGSLTIKQIETELERVGYNQPEAKPLLYAIGQDTILRQAIQVPFYYNTLQLLFASGKKLSDLHFTAETISGRQAEITEQFVSHELGLSLSQGYTKEQAKSWLSFLTFNLNRNDRVVFELVDLQYSWWNKWSKKELFIINFICLNLFPAIRSVLGLYKETPYISTIDSIKWSWSMYFKTVKKNLKIGLFLGLILCLIIAFIVGQKKGLKIGLFDGLIFGSIYGLTICLFFRFNLHFYNVGIIQIDKPYQRFMASMKVLHFSILQHFHLRHLLAKRGLLPFKLVNFLNDMTERNILESDGATWRFRHGLLQDYFYESHDFETTNTDYFNKGYHYGTKDDNDKTIHFYENAIALKPDDHEAFNNMGIAYNNKEDYDKAIESYERAIEIKPDKHDAFNNMGIAYNNKGDYDKAIESYERAIEIKPDKHEAFNNMGFAYDNKGDYDKAIESYQKAIEINPDYLLAFINMGNAYGDKGDYDKMIESYQKAVEIKPDYHKVYNSWGFCLIKYGRIADAEFVLQKAVDLGDFGTGNMNLGHVYLCQGNKEKALVCYKSSLSHFEGNDAFWAGMKDDFQYLTQYGITEEYYKNVLGEI